VAAGVAMLAFMFAFALAFELLFVFSQAPKTSAMNSAGKSPDL
jgi:hypothetical protein